MAGGHNYGGRGGGSEGEEPQQKGEELAVLGHGDSNELMQGIVRSGKSLKCENLEYKLYFKGEIKETCSVPQHRWPRYTRHLCGVW